jgi:hypothetical protein
MVKAVVTTMQPLEASAMKRDSNVMGIDIAKRVWLLFDSRVVDVPTDIEQVCEVEKPFILL